MFAIYFQTILKKKKSSICVQVWIYIVNVAKYLQLVNLGDVCTCVCTSVSVFL